MPKAFSTTSYPYVILYYRGPLTLPGCYHGGELQAKVNLGTPSYPIDKMGIHLYLGMGKIVSPSQQVNRG